MKKFCVFWVLLALTLSVFAQSRDDIHIYIPPVIATDPAQANFFKDNFDMETVAAGYTLTESSNGADYTLRLEVQPNMIFYSDGSSEPAPPEEGLYLLQINLVRNEDDADIVAFSFAFTELEEMYEYNLYLLYEAMANVPLTKLTGSGVVLDDRWRNKWLYIRASLDYPITFYGLIDPFYLTEKDPDDPNKRQVTPLNNKISPWLAATIGFEIQYLNWMSTELGFNLSFSDPLSTAFIPALQIEQKFPIKPSTHFMIEPYIAVSFPNNTSPNVMKFPTMGIGGGVQLGVKGGAAGAFFIDLNFIYYLGDVVMAQTNSYYKETSETYYRFVVGLGIGYKIGFLDRPVKKQEAPPSYSLVPPAPVSVESYDMGDDGPITDGDFFEEPGVDGL